MAFENYPKFSIITPSYNQGQFIERAILSVLDQDYPDFEHIVVDNCSDDNTLEILKSYPHLRWISEPDNGQSEAINKGFQMAEGEILAWLNADESYYKNTFNIIREHYIQNESVDVFYGDVDFVDGEGKLIRHKREIDFDENILLYYGCYIPSAATFFRRRIIEEGQYLNESYHYTMDFEYYVRLSKKGYTFKHIPKTLANFMWTGDNKSLNANRRKKERNRVQRKYGFKHQFLNRIFTEIFRLKRQLYKFI